MEDYEQEEKNLVGSAKLYVKTEVCTYNWQIKNFSFLSQESVDSPDFSGPYPSWNWHFQLCPRKITHHRYECLVSYISDSKHYLALTAEFVNGEGVTFRTTQYGPEHTDECILMQMSRNKLLAELGDDDELTILLTFTYLPEETVDANLVHVPPYVFPNVVHHLKEDLYRMFQERKYCDVVITVDGQHIPTHRSILTSRSQVFEAMFVTDMREQQTRRIDINDFDQYTVQCFLEFLYTAELPTPFTLDIAVPLLRIANKYLVKDLQTTCVEFLVGICKGSNVSVIQNVADSIQDERLLLACKTYNEA